MREFFNHLKNLEMQHRIFAFLAIFIGTIIFTRFLVFFYNPNPIIFDFELHHFDYGILLLIGTSLVLILESNGHPIFLFLIAVATGLIVDDYWFIRRSVVEKGSEQLQIYRSTFTFVVFLTIAIVLFIYLFNSIKKRRGK